MTLNEAKEVAICLNAFQDIGYLGGQGAEFRYWFRESAKTIRELVAVIEKTIKPFKDEE